jgi:hypothetical protein
MGPASLGMPMAMNIVNPAAFKVRPLLSKDALLRLFFKSFIT